MDINRLTEFITLATQLNYSKAANQLYLTQPALSRHIHDLEQTLGVKLFIRDTHNVRLTSVGEVFLQEARVIMDHYNHALDLVKASSQLSNGKLTMGTLETASRPFLSQFLIGFISSHPNIKLDFYCDTMEKLVSDLNQGECDLALVTHVDKNLFSGMESERITTSRMHAVVNPIHPLAKKDYVSMKDLATARIINFAPAINPITADFNKFLFKKAGLTPNIVLEVPNIETGLFYVSLNEGVFFLPEYLINQADSLKVLPIIDEHCEIGLNLIWRKDNPNFTVPIFTNEFRSYLQNRD